MIGGYTVTLPPDQQPQSKSSSGGSTAAPAPHVPLVELDAQGGQQLPGGALINAIGTQIFGQPLDPNTTAYYENQITQMRSQGMTDSQVVSHIVNDLTSGNLSGTFQQCRQGVENNTLATDINNAVYNVLGTNVDANTMKFFMTTAQQMQHGGATDAQIMAYVQTQIMPGGSLSGQFEATRAQLASSVGTTGTAAPATSGSTTSGSTSAPAPPSSQTSATNLVDQVMGINPKNNPGPLATQGAPPAPTGTPYAQMLNALLGTGGAPAGVPVSSPYMSTGTNPLASLNSLFPTGGGTGASSFAPAGTANSALIAQYTSMMPGASDYSSLISNAQASMAAMTNQMNQQMQTMNSMFTGSGSVQNFTSAFGSTPQFSIPSSLAAYAPPVMM